jgi:CRISPR/Cas system-associated protein Cas10 (large subunit of type III CRISPR-Cas system)
MDKELERLEQLKKEAIENPGKKKKGCTSCKKKKEITAPLPQLEVVFIPTLDDIKKAYAYLGNVKEEEKKFINDVYIALFNQEFDFTCGSCGNKQARRLYNYLKYELNAIL